ncbi:HIPL2 protein [Raphanus sativus]|nr:HIPL2 protein [Raphanus sativus]
MELDESTPFVDITDQVSFDTQFGMMGMAFHPKFAENGRFFASFNCDKVKSPGCTGRCACNSDVNCDASKLPKDDGDQPCRYQTVVAEYTANGTSSSPSTAKTGKASEVRRIFTMGLPYSSSHGGQILFGPDGYLYLMTGDGGGVSDTHNFAQNKKSLLGKILRLDVDVMPSVSEISQLGLWGNYSIPKSNPFQGNADEQGEIYALGLRNPWRCSFDSERPEYFLCADVGKDTYEEVDIITMGGNYGWRIYEGPYVFSPLSPFGENVSEVSNLTFPILGYNHSEVNKHEGSASIIGGYFYRSNTDPCSYGTYLYADLYANAMWAAIESPEGSGNFTDSQIPIKCSQDSPVKCTAAPGGADSGPALGYIYSFGQDNNKDIHLLTSSGVYRVVRPSRCNFACSKENTTASSGKQSPSGAGPPQSLPSSARNHSLVSVVQDLFKACVRRKIISSVMSINSYSRSESL